MQLVTIHTMQKVSSGLSFANCHAVIKQRTRSVERTAGSRPGCNLFGFRIRAQRNL
jgi:hypothetical protein